MNNRIEILRSYIEQLTNTEKRAESWHVEKHMLVVSNFSPMIALKRGLDPEIATMVAFLHDLHTLLTGNSTNHAKFSSMLAREILTELSIVTEDEMDTICEAIKNHSTKREIHDPYSEIIKDADVLSHYFQNVSLPIAEKDEMRLEALVNEFGLHFYRRDKDS